MESLVHIGMGLNLAAYAVRDILWLRLLAVVACVVLVTAHLLRPEPLVTTAAWNGLFAAVNVVWAAWLIRERQPVDLGPDERIVNEVAFPSLSVREVRRLLDVCTWEDAEAGDELVPHGVVLDYILVLARGVAAIEVRGGKVASTHEGQLLGEVSFLTGGVTSARVVAEGPVRCARWDSAVFRRFMERRADRRTHMLSDMSRDAASKLRER